MVEGPKTRSEQILGAILINPELIDVVAELSPRDFTHEAEASLFSEILKQWEDKHQLDEFELGENVPGGQSYLQRIQTGMLSKSLQAFLGDVRELKKLKYQESIFSLLEEQKRLVKKTGADVGFDIQKLKAEIEAIEALDSDHAHPSLTVFLSGVEPKPVEWLWPNFIPLGKASMISGDPNVGKTWLALDIAARLSKGLAWPDGSFGLETANVLYLTVEDNPHDTLRPRIDSLGGDPSKIAIINPGYSDFISFAEQDGIKKLEQEILKIGNVRLVVLDPILDFSGGINPNAAERVRAFLTPLIHIAEKLNLALVLIAHLNKAQSQSAIYRTGGATSAWLGKCRAAFMIFRDREEKKKRYISAIKSNLAQEDPPQLSFIPDAGHLLFEKVVEEVDVDEHLNPQLRDQGDEKEEASFATNWLKEALKDGPVDSKKIRELAAENGIPRTTLYRAMRKLGTVAKIEGFGGFKTSSWALPEGEKEIEELPF
jgi:hypothetical protein